MVRQYYKSARESSVLGTIIMGELGFRPPPRQSEVAADEFGSIELSADGTDFSLDHGVVE